MYKMKRTILKRIYIEGSKKPRKIKRQLNIRDTDEIFFLLFERKES